MADSASIRTGDIIYRGLRRLYMLTFTVIRYPTLLLVFCLGSSGLASAQGADAALPEALPGMAGMGGTGEIAPDSPYAMPMPIGRDDLPARIAPLPSFAGRPAQGVRPVVVLPAPPMSPYPAGTMSGLHGPGSYVPRETPLHRFSGYVVCDPPPHHVANIASSGPDAGTGERPKRVVKTTSTRSPAAPGYLQPCPIYTVNGQLPLQENRLQPPSVSGKPEGMKP